MLTPTTGPTVPSPQCEATVSQAHPAKGAELYVNVLTRLRSAGIIMSVHYPDRTENYAGETDGSGSGIIAFAVGESGDGQPVPIEVEVGGEVGCATGFYLS